MQDHLEMLTDAAKRAQARLLAVLAGLSLEQINALPVREFAPSVKSVGWLVWHTAREQDLQIADLAGREPLWTAQGWNKRFGFDLPDDTQDWRHTPQEAAKVVIRDEAVLTGYLDTATQAVVDYLRQPDSASLAEIIDRNWNPPVTRAQRLVSIIDDAAMHSGQAVYARRLMGLAD
ncbi:DinB family protein [Neisseria chenwenguii]|uniref:Uncharacterized protein n=1 Tax=Neisseria chenwenguii TaxID=1853278 RepID=A0A220RZ33_9NEIS|nr:DinB family protein [Neisseria chenwenguii]ASK26454.1 hypothetical protein BG910_00670 [Neisseria chenwenguii]ROV55896.1 DUF664 domain-containing protein [Neisseria chenwenguii]